MNADLIAIQQQLESESIGLGIDNYVRAKDKAKANKDTANLAPENFLLRKALIRVSDCIRDHLETNKRGGKEYAELRSILVRVNPDVCAYLTLQVALNNTSVSPSVLVLALQLGTRVRQHLDYMAFKKDMPGYLKAVEKTMNSKSGKYQSTVLSMVMDKKGIKREKWTHNKETAVKVGSFLIERMMESVPLFKKVRKGKLDSHVLMMLPRTNEWLEKAHAKCAEMSPQYLPMVVNPRKWDAMYSGGFLSPAGPFRLSAVRFRHGLDMSEHFEDVDISNVYACLNTLQDTPYRINSRVLEVIREGAETGLGSLPKPDIKMELAPTFWNSDAEFQELSIIDPERIKEWKLSRKQTYDKWYRSASARKTLHWQLWIADKFKDFDSIFFCWNTDWRGRVYPIQQYVNPQADSNGKALLEFATGKALGEHGAYWLAVHGANTFGYDKATMDDRVKWVADHKDMILDSARNPLDGSRFWCEADSPYMFLAFCFEWAAYVEQGESFVSHLPVNMDGSCSGLQHYSALLKDEVGERYVNLVPTEKPSDIYAKVAEVAGSLIAKDTESEEAEWWHGKIDRGIAKRNTMTWTYSATLYGFTDQLEEEINKRDAVEFDRNGQYFLGDSKRNRKASMYMAKKNLEAIGSVVVKAVEAMDYLKTTAKVMAEANVPMEWLAPSGMKVVHHYGKTKTRRVNTIFGGVRMRVSLDVETEEMDAKKNASSIAPNFIHSLDAAHLVRTINACKEEGLNDFMVIHDSFGCHATDLPILNRVIRDQFIEMYEGNVLEDFHCQMLNMLPEEHKEKLSAPPQRGTLDLAKVRDSTYFFA